MGEGFSADKCELRNIIFGNTEVKVELVDFFSSECEVLRIVRGV